MKKKVVSLFLLLALVGAPLVHAQFFGGVVFDPTNYNNAVLRYLQLQQHLVELRNSYNQLVSQYNLAVQMARSIQNMPARYRATFSAWRNAAAQNTYGNTGTWIAGVNSGAASTVISGYAGATTRLLQYNPQALANMTPEELERVKSQYASVELSDGVNTTALTAIGAIRTNTQAVDNQINNLEQDSLSNNPNLNTEVSVLNKINATNVLTLRTLQDSNKLLLSLLEQQVISAKQQREALTNSINADIIRRANLSNNMTRVTGTLTTTLQNFRMP